MIAIISLGLLGIWIVILGIYNAIDWGAGWRQASHISIKCPKETESPPAPHVAEPMIIPEVSTLEKTSPLAGAFRDLWKEISRGA